MTYGETVLVECRHKIERANEHSRILYWEVRNFLATEPYTLIRKYDRKHAQYLLKLKIVKPIPQIQFALIIGDCLHNARTALDYIAWRLAGSKIADTSTLFPIYIRQSRFDDMVKRRQLAHVFHPDALNAIRDVQPYKRFEPEKDLLWLLQDLDAKDKHKLLTMTQAHSFGGQFTAMGGAEIRVTYGRLDEGTIVARVKFPCGTPESEMKVHTQPLFDVAFESAVAGSAQSFPVNSYLPQIIMRVINVVTQFENSITANPHWIPS